MAEHAHREITQRELRNDVFEPLPFDAEAARAFGLVTSAVLATGRTTRRRLADLMIASIAYANGLSLHATNPADFVGLEELVSVRPVRRP
ncbi:hypothetical protein [Micromonospora sp. WMMD737]|uniref:hypothetical protein n=1 Tax=Micromonospora sp. WMMD737 TaxID=3404113 RepID=UPI003B926C20